MRQMLLPTFHKLFPGKKMIFYIDNAPYHRCQGPEGEISINNCKRAELINWLVEACQEQGLSNVSWVSNHNTLAKRVLHILLFLRG